MFNKASGPRKQSLQRVPQGAVADLAPVHFRRDSDPVHLRPDPPNFRPDPGNRRERIQSILDLIPADQRQ